jgi:hypothetical protein
VRHLRQRRAMRINISFDIRFANFDQSNIQRSSLISSFTIHLPGACEQPSVSPLEASETAKRAKMRAIKGECLNDDDPTSK